MRSVEIQAVPLARLFHIPRQQLIHSIDRMLGNDRQYFGEIRLWIKTVELGGIDQAIHQGGSLTTSIRAVKEIVLSSCRYRANCRSMVVVDLYTAVVIEEFIA